MKSSDPYKPTLLCCQIGQLSYEEALNLQSRMAAARRAGSIPDLLLLLEHPPIYTKGRRSSPSELPMATEWYRDRGIQVMETDRGGRTTYHGPGQLVGYPILSLKPWGNDVHRYIRLMEQAIISTLHDSGVEAAAEDGLTGVWTGGCKIASIGIHVSRGVTTHGFAINASNDLEPFEWIVPCGIEGCQVTSISKETCSEVEMDELNKRCAESFAQVFKRSLKFEPDPSLASLLARDDRGSV